MQTSDQRISVALCTYNGERFLPRQLASIQQQTRLPDELVVCDDGSVDNTIDILRDFADSVSFPVKISINEKNLGFVRNFEQAIQLCCGDLIALSDQDDIWYPNRLERSENELASHPEAGLVFSDGEIIDDQDQPTGAHLWSSFNFSGDLKQRLLEGDYTVFVKRRFVTGATVMFRSRLRSTCIPIGEGWLHDEWIVPTVAGVADVRPIDTPLIRYRQHASQQVGITSVPGFRERQKRHWIELSRQIGMLHQICARLAKQPLTERGAALFSVYQAHLRFARFRLALPSHRLARVLPLLAQKASYTTCGSGLRSMANDLILGK
jgi:glycosyltransferase involved in cell wall biosynthesis